MNWYKAMAFYLAGKNSLNGAFSSAMLDALFNADLDNLRRIEKGFPDLTAARQAYITGDRQAFVDNAGEQYAKMVWGDEL